jgi:hypothetical protein
VLALTRGRRGAKGRAEEGRAEGEEEEGQKKKDTQCALNGFDLIGGGVESQFLPQGLAPE